MRAGTDVAASGPEADLTALRDAYLAAVLAPGSRGARTLVEDACMAGVAGEHLATRITQAVRAALAAQAPDAARTG